MQHNGQKQGFDIFVRTEHTPWNLNSGTVHDGVCNFWGSTVIGQTKVLYNKGISKNISVSF